MIGSRMRGFALPTVLITSVAMMIILLASLASLSSIAQSLRNQYYQQLANEAAESGYAYAANCLKTYQTMSTTGLYVPNSTSCSDPTVSTTRPKYILDTPILKTAYEFSPPIKQADNIYTVSVRGYTYLFSTSNSTVVVSSITTTLNFKVTTGAVLPDALKLGASTSIAAKLPDGSVWGWGDNSQSAVGDGGSSGVVTLPKKIIDGSIRDVVVTGTYQYETKYAITETNDVYAWGRNDYGQVGNGTTTNQATPYRITSLNGKVKEIFTDGASAYAVTFTGQLYGWGLNSSGLITSDTTSNVLTPTLISGVSNVDRVILNRLSKDAGFNAVGVLTTGKDLYIWGGGKSYLLGNGSTITNLYGAPRLVMSNVKDVKLFGSAAAAVATDGSVYQWGYYFNTSTSHLTYLSPTKIPGLSNIAKVSGYIDSFATRGSMFALGENGVLYSFGGGYSGDGSGTARSPMDPYQINSFGDSVKEVQTSTNGTDGTTSVFALANNGSVWSWGGNNLCQLGNGSLNPAISYTPTKVIDGGSNKVVKMIAYVENRNTSFGGSSGSMYALKEDGSLWAWGVNKYATYTGVAGAGSVDDGICTPIKMLDNVKSVYKSGFNAAFAIRNDGSLWSWGAINLKQIGRNTTTQYPYSLPGPVDLPAPPPVVF